MCMSGFKISQMRLKPHCSGYRIWWSLRNWLGTRSCIVFVCQHLPPRYQEPLPSASDFPLLPHLPLLLGVCSPGHSSVLGMLAYRSQDRLIVSTSGICLHTLLPNSSLGEKLLGWLSVKIDAFSLLPLLFYSFIFPPEEMIYWVQ